MNPLTNIPAKYRLWIYSVFSLVGVVIGALDVAHVDSIGSWPLDTVKDVYAYLGLALGLTAASNVTRQDVPKPAPKHNPLNEKGASALGVIGIVLVVIGLLDVIMLAVGQALFPLVWAIVLLVVGAILVVVDRPRMRF